MILTVSETVLTMSFLELETAWRKAFPDSDIRSAVGTGSAVVVRYGDVSCLLYTSDAADE